MRDVLAFKSGDHALAAGMFVGFAARHGITLIPELDSEGNFTPRYTVELPRNLNLNKDATITINLIIDPPTVTSD